MVLPSDILCSLARGGGNGFIIVVVIVEEGGRGDSCWDEIDAAAGLIHSLQLADVNAEVVHYGVGSLEDQGGWGLLAC